jgi:hypothetical protein
LDRRNKGLIENCDDGRPVEQPEDLLRTPGVAPDGI